MDSKGSSRGPRAANRRRTLFVSEIFWPHTLLDITEHAFLIGWNLDNFNCCIVNVIALPASQYEQLEGALSEVLSVNPPGMQCSKNTARPVILGEWFPNGVGEATLPAVRHQELGIWISLTGFAKDGPQTDWSRRRDKGSQVDRPELLSLYSCGCRYNISCYLFRYDATAPERHYYLTIDLPKHFGFFTLDRAMCIDSSGDKLQSQSATDLECVVEQINSSGYLKHLINKTMGRRSTEVGAEDSSWVSVGNRLVLMTAWITIRACCMWYFFSKQSAEIIASSSSLVKTAMGHLLKITPTVSGDQSRDLSKDYHILFSVNHLHRKFISVQSSFNVYLLITRNHTLTPVERQSQWIYLWSYIMNTICDVVAGCIVGWFLIRYNSEIISYLFSIGPWVQNDILIAGIKWFDSSPGGMKLNPTLTSHIGQILTAVISYFGTFVRIFSEIYKHILFILADVGVFGVTMQMTVLVDILRISTIHLNVIQLVFSVLHKLQVSVLNSMWLLFTGRKKNVLRKRIDTEEYSQSQVVLGTTFFAISFFLFPTFCVYYAAFTAAQLVVVSCCSVLLFFVKFLQFFPLCHLVLHYLYPESLVKGIQVCFEDSQGATVSVITTTAGQTGSVFTRRRGSSSSIAPPNLSSRSLDKLSRYPTKAKASESRFVAFPSSQKVHSGKGILKKSTDKTVVNDPIYGSRDRIHDMSNEESEPAKVLSFADPGKGSRLLHQIEGDDDRFSFGISSTSRDSETRGEEKLSSSANLHSLLPVTERTDVGSMQKNILFNVASDCSDYDGDDNSTDTRKYRPLDEYSFSIEDQQDMSEIASIPQLDVSSVEVNVGDRFCRSSEHEVVILKDSVNRHVTSPDIASKSTPHVAKSGTGNKSVYLNILPQKTGVSTILANFIYLWNNKVNRDTLKLCTKELVSGIVLGHISLNMRSLNIVENYCTNQLSNYRSLTSDGSGSDKNRSGVGRSDVVVGIDGEIVPPSGGDTLIDYFKSDRLHGPVYLNSTHCRDTPSAYLPDSDGREPSDSDNPPLESARWTRQVPASSLTMPPLSPLLRTSGKSKSSPSSLDDGTCEESVHMGSNYRRQIVSSDHHGFVCRELKRTVGDGDSSIASDVSNSNIALRKGAWVASPGQMNDFWIKLYADAGLEIRPSSQDVLSNTFRIPDLFVYLFCIQSLSFILLVIGVVLLLADVIFLCFPDLMPVSYIGLFYTVGSTTAI